MGRRAGAAGLAGRREWRAVRPGPAYPENPPHTYPHCVTLSNSCRNTMTGFGERNQHETRMSQQHRPRSHSESVTESTLAGDRTCEHTMVCHQENIETRWGAGPGRSLTLTGSLSAAASGSTEAIGARAPAPPRPLSPLHFSFCPFLPLQVACSAPSRRGDRESQQTCRAGALPRATRAGVAHLEGSSGLCPVPQPLTLETASREGCYPFSEGTVPNCSVSLRVDDSTYTLNINHIQT